MLDVDVTRRLGSFTLEAKFASDHGVTALFGRSGSGKTSLVRLIAGLLRPDAGRIVAGGEVLFDRAAGIDLPPSRRRVGVVFQEGLLFPHLSVRQNLLYGRFFTRADERYADVGQVVDLLGLDSLLARRPGDLSGGEKQRVAIGRALLASPRLLLLDEPLAALDDPRKEEILPYIERLRDEMSLPIVYVSHSLGEVTRLAATMVLLSDGKVAASGPVESVLGRLDLRPMTGRYEAGSLLQARVAGHDPAYGLTRLELNDGQGLAVPSAGLPFGSIVRIRIRARDVALAIVRPEGISIRNVLAGRVVEIAATTGPIAEVAIAIGEQSLIARVTRQAVDALRLEPGAEVYALVKSIAFDRRSLTATTAIRAPDD